jgi:hypothetical protein
LMDYLWTQVFIAQATGIGTQQLSGAVHESLRRL